MDFSKLETDILLENNSPFDDFLGLSSNNMHNLLYYPYSDNSPVQLRSDLDNATLDRIPFFRIVEELLKVIRRDGFIKLTPLGALPKKIMVELYSYKYIPEEFIEKGISKLLRQQDSVSIETARFVAEVARLAKKLKGKFLLTKKGTTLLKPESRLQLFETVLQTFTQGFNWGYNDGYPAQPIGQLGWAFSVFMLDRFGDQLRRGEFYGDKYLRAFPHFITFFDDDYGTPADNCKSCYSLRVFDRFFDWFGFVTVEKRATIFDKSSYKATDLLQKVFVIEKD